MSDMSMTSPHHLSCPVCHQPLNIEGKQARCTNNHHFDQARQGYWNLLLVQRKKSKQPGDNVEMVQARERLLNSRAYDHLSDEINRIAAGTISHPESSDTPVSILDAGCGEGFYTDRLERHLASTNPTQTIGFDISLPAIKLACKRSKTIQWLVASSADIPVEDNSQDLILALFTRLMPEEFARISHHHGYLLVATTGENHLQELRAHIYDEVIKHSFDPSEQLSTHFMPASEQALTNVSYTTQLNSNELIHDLLMMTPHYWRIKPEAKARLQALDQLSITVDVNLWLFQPRQ